MIKINVIGDELRKLRKQAKESLTETAAAVGIDRTHLNKIELGTYKPKPQLLDALIAHFLVEGNTANQLRNILKYDMNEQQVELVVVGGIKERNTQMPNDLQLAQPATQVVLDPSKTPVMYTDSIFVTSSDYGLVLDVAQLVPGNQQHHVVARIGMSYDHAKKLLEMVNDHLQKYER